MFRFLMERHGAAAAAGGECADARAPAVAPAGGAAAPAPAREGPGPGAGARRAGLIKMLWPNRSRIASKLRNLESDVKATMTIVNPGVATKVSREIFGVGAQIKGKINELVALTVDPAATVVVNRRRQIGRLFRRGLASHVKRQREGLVEEVNSGVNCMIHYDAMDEATMWVRAPATQKDKTARVADVRRNKNRHPRKLGKRCGKNQAVSVLNVLQYMYLMDSAGSLAKWKTLQVHIPAQALPKGNWATVLNRKRRWSMYSGQVGSCLLASESELPAKIAKIEIISKAGVCDDASVNRCMTCAEQRDMVAQRTSELFRLHFDLKCQSHQCCLVARPALETCGDLATVITRLSHILGIHRTMSSFIQCLDAWFRNI